ncbi:MULTISPECIES: Crp/Fnr family transcriptional regulator [Hoeflea]|jgi:CRP-like cAMP-binding protein|uniref:Crp/Fnr family transcriptional regulator n=1 Tax=Hoeflea TaxID=274591 RepID=UPI001252B12E|nr:Crp/Fnr family transcriptional regulator [Hoeflea sp. EC-HK425]MBV6648429.1 Crp/Fnr family transcriptional regulator [Hoeflea sp.]VVT27752.1 Crp/Fnr family transcriptional regulator [Hoeflea sp. EC-HK425]|tara:strand:+ start:434 stop:1141 length:708 start_codon:yes stop_codon:yes gene_type:complete
MSRLDPSLLAGLPPFMGMDQPALEHILEGAKPLRQPKNAHVFRQGEEAHSFYLLLDGYVRVVKLAPDGEQVIVRFIASGELLGIAKAIGRDSYPANAVAAADCVLLAWPSHLWESIVSAHPGFATNTYAMLGERLLETQDKVVELATERVEQRVANAVLKLANQSGRKTEEGTLIDFPISRQDISEMTGTTLHTVSRLLSGWEHAGWVKSSRQKVTLMEGHKLVMVASGQAGRRS